MKNKTSFLPDRFMEVGLEAAPPHASPFISSSPKAGQKMQEVSHIRLHVAPSQQEVNLYNLIHAITVTYEKETHTVPKKFLRGKITRDSNSK